MIKERVKNILDKYPKSKNNRGEFMWHYMEEYHGAKIYAMKSQFLSFWQEEATVERELRDFLKQPEYSLSEDNEEKRMNKADRFAGVKNEHKRWKKTLTEEDKKKYEQAFGGNTEEEQLKEVSERCL